jgi:hypothetical protein
MVGIEDADGMAEQRVVLTLHSAEDLEVVADLLGAVGEDQTATDRIEVIAWPGPPDHTHSHITGVRAGESDRRIRYAMKFHQRRWALDRGSRITSWTFDPLVSRNAYFNLCGPGVPVTPFAPELCSWLSVTASPSIRSPGAWWRNEISMPWSMLSGNGLPCMIGSHPCSRVQTGSPE